MQAAKGVRNSRVGLNEEQIALAERTRLRRDFRELSGAERAEQVIELSAFLSRVAEAGRRRRR